MQSKVHPTYKTQYRVANWPAYHQALVRRDDVTVWVSSEAIAAWTARRSGRRGGQVRYSDLAIETALTLRLISHLPLRQAAGFLHALFGIMRLDLSVPDDTTRSRRRQHLRRHLRSVPPGESLHLVLDSTGLSLVGAGEWAAATHGGCGRRGWRTLHRGVDQSGVIRVHTLTEKTGDDATTAVDRRTAVEGPLVRVTAAAASDTGAVDETATARGATVVIPPARTANVSGHGPRAPARDRTIMWVKTRGRRRWKQEAGYYLQARVEHACLRYQSMIGEGLRARRPAGQGSEVVLGCAILNRMTALGRPVSYRLDRGGSCRWAACGPVTIRATTPREGFGVGAHTAAELLIIFGDNPDRIRSEAAFAKLCGACPIPASSGMTTGRHRLNRGGHRQANAALYRAVIVRMRFHQPTRDYVARRTANGRTKCEIIRCLKRFLAREIYQRVMTDYRARQEIIQAA